MKPNIIPSSFATAIALAFLAFTSCVFADVEDQIAKSFDVKPGGQLMVEADRGAIEVKTADRAVVDIEITRKARGSAASAEKVLKDHTVTITQDGNKVEVRATYSGSRWTGWFGRSPDLQVNYVITIPPEFNVNLKTAGGNIKVTDLKGKTEARTSGGNLTLEKIIGPVSGFTSGGNIKALGCQGPVDLKTSGGNLNLGDIQGDVTAQTSGGSIRADGLSGKSVLGTSGGNIAVESLKGAVEARTSGGSITASVREQPSGDCTFKSSGGSISVVLAASAAVDVDLHTSGGRVSSDFPVTTVVQGEQKKHELRGKINGGGPLITARTSGGNVRLEKK